jgi:Spy/CpxP family protein refolding chaperone
MTKNNKVRTLAGLAIAAAVVGIIAVGVSFAQQPAGPPHGKMMMGRGSMGGGPFAEIRRGLAQLGLTDQQKTQIKAIFAGHKADIQGFASRMQPARQALHNAITSGADEAAIRKAAAGVAAVEADMAVFHAAVRTQVFAVLTPDQQAKASQLQQQTQQRWMGRRRGPRF